MMIFGGIDHESPVWVVIGIVLVVDGPLVVPWENVRQVLHRAGTTRVTGWSWGVMYSTSYFDLTLDGTADRLRVTGARRQRRLSAMIIDATRDQILGRLTAQFQHAGVLKLGELTVARDGVYNRPGHAPRPGW